MNESMNQFLRAEVSKRGRGWVETLDLEQRKLLKEKMESDRLRSFCVCVCG